MVEYGRVPRNFLRKDMLCSEVDNARKSSELITLVVTSEEFWRELAKSTEKPNKPSYSLLAEMKLGKKAEKRPEHMYEVFPNRPKCSGLVMRGA